MRHVVGLVVAGGLLLAAVPAVATGRGGTRPGWFPAEALAVQQTLRHLAGIERLPGVVGRSPLRSGVAGPRTAAASSGPTSTAASWGPTSTAASWGPTSTAASSGAASPDYCNQLIPAGRALPGAPLSVLDACDGGGETGPTYWDQWDLIMRRVDTGRAAWEVRVERHGIGYVLVSPGRSPAVPEILFLGLDGLDGPGPLQFTLHAYAPATGRLLWSRVWTQQAQPTVPNVTGPPPENTPEWDGVLHRADGGFDLLLAWRGSRVTAQGESFDDALQPFVVDGLTGRVHNVGGLIETLDTPASVWPVPSLDGDHADDVIALEPPPMTIGAGAAMDAVTGNSAVVGLDAQTGAVRWRNSQLPFDTNSSAYSGIGGVQSGVYFLGTQGTEKLEPTTGRPYWTIAGSCASDLAPGVSLACDDSGQGSENVERFVAITDTGRRLWTRTVQLGMQSPYYISVWGAGDVEPDGIMEAGIVVLGDCPCTLPPVADLLVDGHTGRLLQNNFSYFPMYLSVRPPGDDFLDASYRPEGSYHPQQFFLAVRDGHHFRPIWQRVQPLTDKVSAWAAFFVGPVPGANTIPFIGSCVARQGQGRDCLWLDARTGRPVYRDLLPLTAP